jgi:fluoride exporter
MILVGIGGTIGSILRYMISQIRPIRGVPAGTLTVNIVGSFALSAIAFTNPGNEMYALLCTGLLGGFTTFSTFGFETFRMLEDRDYYTALTNILLNLGGGLLGIYLGYRILM